jgi:hypothetical protein
MKDPTGRALARLDKLQASIKQWLCQKTNNNRPGKPLKYDEEVGVP